MNTGSLSRKAHGIEFGAPAGVDKLMPSDKVSIELDIQFILTPADAHTAAYAADDGPRSVDA